MHLAAQYLAAAGISFVEKKDDDSHTNLGFSIEEASLETHPLSENGDILSLDYKNFSLNWSSESGSTSFPLNGAIHEDVLQWLEETSNTFLNKAYSYVFHYSLPYKITNDFKFELTNVNRLEELIQLRILAQSALKEVLKRSNLESPIRVWPHHFDIGAYSSFKDASNIAVGFGLAVPDAICAEHYFYISGYEGHDAVSTEGFSSLTNGHWKNDGFKGAILPASKIEKEEAVLFFKETIQNYITAR